MAEYFKDVINDIVDFCYGAIITEEEGGEIYVNMDDTETFRVIKGIASILDFKYDVLKQAVYEGYTAEDMFRAEIKYRRRPDKKEVYELICEALGVNFMATKEDLKQLIDEL